MQAFLDSKGRDKVGTVDVFSANFGNGVEIDIKVCDGDTPFIDAVLFVNGCDSGYLDAGDTLLGEYVFENRTVILELDDEREKEKI